MFQWMFHVYIACYASLLQLHVTPASLHRYRFKTSDIPDILDCKMQCLPMLMFGDTHLKHGWLLAESRILRNNSTT